MRRWLPSALVWLALVAGYVLLLRHGIECQTDSSVYYHAGLVGECSYTSNLVRQVDGGYLPFLYSPVTQPLFALLAWAGWGVNYWLYAALALGGCAAWGVTCLGWRRGWLGLCWPGAAFCVLGGNIEPLLWLLSNSRVGLLCAGLFKPYWWLLLLVDRRAWSRRDLFVAAGVVGLLLGTVTWWPSWLAGLSSVRHLTAWDANLSLANLSRYGCPIPVVLLSAICDLVTIIAWRRGKLRDSYARVLLVMCQPLCRLYYLPYVLVAAREVMADVQRYRDRQYAGDRCGVDGAA